MNSLYNFVAFFAHAFLARARHGFDHHGYLEPVYRDLFLRELRQLGLDDIYYPIGGAANHSLLYILARILTHYAIERVIEFGCGQSSLLIDAIGQQRHHPMHAMAFEHDLFWAEHIADRTRYDVFISPLVKKNVLGEPCLTYDINVLDGLPAFDLFVVDGPPGSFRNSRFGALEIVQRHLAPDFIIIFDDAGRLGEVDTVRACRSLLKAMQVDVSEKIFDGGTRQHVFFTERYRHVAAF